MNENHERKIHILVVDDEPAHAELVCRSFATQNGKYKVIVASSLSEARDQLATHSIELIITDFMLPDGQGTQLLSNHARASLPLIVMTSHGDEQVAVEAMKAGAMDYVVKSAVTLNDMPHVAARTLREWEHLTERVRAEQALKESEERYRTLYEDNPSMYFTLNAEGLILSVNQFGAKQLGYTVSELVGQSLVRLIHVEDQGLFRLQLDTCLLESPRMVQWEYRNIRKDESILWVRESARAVRKQNGDWIVLAVCEDITQNKQREHALETIADVSSALRTASTRAEIVPTILERVSNLFAASMAAMIVRDPVTDVVTVELGNGEWAALSGQPFPDGKEVFERVTETHTPYLANDVSQDSLIPHLHLNGKINVIACVPLIAKEKTIGALLVGRKRAITEQALRSLVSIGDIAANAIHRTTLHEQTELRLQHLAALNSIDRAISSSIDLRITLNILLEQVVAQLHVHATNILLFDPHLHTLEHAAGRGFRSRSDETAQLRLAREYAAQAVRERQIISILNFGETTVKDWGSTTVAMPETNSKSFYAVPLIARGQVIGVLNIFHHTPFAPDPEWLDLLEALSIQAAIAIDNATLFEKLQHANMELALAYDATIEGWSRALDLRDQETEGHTQRVTKMTVHLAQALGLQGDELVHIRRGALLHDIGKMAISDNILLKPSELNEKEWEKMRQHPSFAREMLSQIAYLAQALDIPYHHHERFDGSGYPLGLRGEQIPLAARIFAVADVWDALTSDRPYRKAWSRDKALQYLCDQAGRHFDPEVIRVFVEVVKNEEHQK